MILRRITEHVKAQNWTAVALDFVIVVVGVFVGIQVSNWNDANTERADAENLLIRLHEEINALLDIQKGEYETHLPRAEALSAVHPLLFDAAPGRALTNKECGAIGISHWLPAPTDELPILEEAIATGQFDLISDDAIKENLRKFALTRNRARRQYNEAINELFRLSARHPQAIWYVRTPSDEPDTPDTPGLRGLLSPAQLARRVGEGFQWAYDCDLQQMRNDRTFLAEYVDNNSRLNSFLDRYEEMIDVITDLEKALADALGNASRPEQQEAP